MSKQVVINAAALEPLFATWEEPNAHRVRVRDDATTKVEKGRRPSPITIVNNLRIAVRDWREAFYAGASDTTRYLLEHWFERNHRQKTPSGEEFEFRYYFCQREAIETLIYLREVRGIRCLSQMVGEFGGPGAELAALGITEEEDSWGRYCFKLATGTGKTKVMSLAVVWSYFHALRESDSDMARHFVVIAPNLTVFERLKEDFKPEGGGRDIFDKDPLIPSEWRGDWNLSVVLQSEASGAATGGTLYLTNIHQLYDYSKRQKTREADTYSFMGPAVSRTKALDTGAELRERITSHKRVMILNDEAHHVWDPDSAWSEAIGYLHETLYKRTGEGLVAQLDFTATPKDNKGQVFKYVVCDTPLGEAVDAGVVKSPIIGSIGNLDVQASDDAAYRYEPHLRLGYARWQVSREEWAGSGKKALMFVMCEDTNAANQIARRLNTDEVFKELNGKTINLHTNLKGKIKYIGRGENKQAQFVESEKEISDEDLRELRKLSRELDQNTSPYSCIVSVLMLREGWDVRNVTTIVPLRPYSSKANILPEQTLGRGLRRMTSPGQANELVTVVEHPAFSSLYRQELSQEGLPIEVIEVDKVPKTTVGIFPDEAHKDIQALDILIPRMTAAHHIVPKLEGLRIEDVRKAFAPMKPLRLDQVQDTELDYEGRHLFTGEVVEQMKIHLPLLESGVGAVSYFVKELEHICKVKNMHQVLAPLIRTFFEEVLFEKKSSIFDPNLISRLSDPDVRAHLHAVFIPLVRSRTTTTEVRTPESNPMSLASWRPFQVTASERRPVRQAENTLFNLVPCNHHLEDALTGFLRRATDVAAFAKNDGPQCLRVDYLSEGRRLAFYTPDFFVRIDGGHCFLVETKGRQDKDVPDKARAAIEWCKSASSKKCRWEYVYVPQGVFQSFHKNSFADLVSACAPALYSLTHEEEERERYPLFASLEPEEEKAPEAAGLVDQQTLDVLPPRYRKAADQAIALFRFFENKEDMNYAPVFAALLGSVDEAAKGLMVRRLSPDLPDTVPDQKAWFDPYLENIDPRTRNYYAAMAQNLKRTLVFRNGLSPIGLLRSCLDFALNDQIEIGGIFLAVKRNFNLPNGDSLLSCITAINDFRNTYVAHQDQELRDINLARMELRRWIDGISRMVEIK